LSRVAGLLDDAAVQIFRVIVRGRFDGLDPAQREQLQMGLDDGANLDAYAFSRTGQLAYDQRIDFFSFRVEIRVPDDAPGDPRETAHSDAEVLATAHLAGRGLAGKDLRVTSQNMADVWR
jgi:hypothetical protein